MSTKRTSSLEKIGYIRKLPKGADINDYESVKLKGKGKKTITLYRNLKDVQEIDDTNNFSRSWDVFNSHLDL